MAALFLAFLAKKHTPVGFGLYLEEGRPRASGSRMELPFSGFFLGLLSISSARSRAKVARVEGREMGGRLPDEPSLHRGSRMEAGRAPTATQ